MEWDIPLDKSSDIPLYRQLSSAIIELIAQGKLSPDTKLPPIRQMAQALNVNNTTVVSAYKYLEQQAAVYTVVGSGTYVARSISVVTPPTQALPVITDEYINFADMATEAALFPVAAFKRAFNAVIDKDGAAAFSHNDSSGYKPLKESICQLLEGLAIKATPDQVHIISNVEEGLDALCRTLLSPGDTVFAERPASQGAIAAFKSRRVLIVEVPMAKEGPDFKTLETLLKKHRPRLFYVSPNYGQPLGICYSAENKRHLLELACEYDFYIVEEDQFGDFYYDGVRKTPLKALDYQDRVVYIKSFSRILTQGFGIGFIVWPGQMHEIRLDANVSLPGYAQRAFDILIRSGDFEAHAANMRRYYGKRYQKMTTAACTYLAPLADFELPGGGLSLWITPRIPHSSDIGDYTNKFLLRKVVVSPGRLFAADMPGFRISFAAVPEERIAEGIGVIASVLAAEL